MLAKCCGTDCSSSGGCNSQYQHRDRYGCILTFSSLVLRSWRWRKGHTSVGPLAKLVVRRYLRCTSLTLIARVRPSKCSRRRVIVLHCLEIDIEASRGERDGDEMIRGARGGLANNLTYLHGRATYSIQAYGVHGCIQRYLLRPLPRSHLRTRTRGPRLS